MPTLKQEIQELREAVAELDGVLERLLRVVDDESKRTDAIAATLATAFDAIAEEQDKLWTAVNDTVVSTLAGSELSATKNIGTEEKNHVIPGID